ncbi:MAG: lipopolysaccharide heptosyltransferase II [Azonexus sp.]|nr:lipopolysaccharide heptosyltransferase II [Betaproteobacteria bacterium]MBK8918837.1 lipopolysaccharide heptosyltransferase II [Betaproteobacteria bacterium]MBP6034769.1 lipopolysaccharide heptosyltransferase II [Azonexus sp.]MBP6905309.1 lipopolysaccharide heptosyltransferase II [Azonexus sp.]
MPRALVVAPSWIGDAVMAQPLFRRLLQATPGLHLDALAPRWVAPVLRRMPEIADIVDSPFGHGETSLKARWRLARSLTERHYDRAYILPNSLKSALVPFLAGIPERVGFIGESRYGLINRRHRLDKAALPLMVERFAQLAEAPGVPPARPIAPPRLLSSPAQQAEALASLGLAPPTRLVAFCPGAEYGPAKRWPEAHFARLARELAARGHSVWLFGSGKDKAVGDAIVAQAAGACRNLCGATGLDQAIDLLALSELVVCNDSGLMHVAAALDRPLVALYGSSSPGFTPPLSERATIASLALSCSPCFKRQCPLGHLDCLQRLEPDRILAACLAHLSP